MRALVTGAAGFIGGALAAALSRQGDVAEVIAFDRLPVTASPGIRPVTGEVADIGASGMGSANEPPAIIVHCAGITAAACEADPAVAYAVNVEGTRALLAWCAGLPRPPRLVLTSTVAVFGGGEPVVTEASRVAPASTYGATKAMAEQLVLDAGRRGIVEGVVARLPVTIVRPGRVGRAGAGFLSDLVIHAAAGRAFEAPLAVDRAIPVASLRDTAEHLVRLGTAPLEGSDIHHVPSLAATARDVLAILAEHGIVPEPGRVTFRPDPGVERLIAGWPERLSSLHGPTPTPLSTILRDWLAVRGGGAGPGPHQG